MCPITERGRFEVLDHYELTNRGAFVVGRILDGVIRPGMRAKTQFDQSALKISGVESLTGVQPRDNQSTRKHWTALIFAEHPTLEFVARAFPIGSVIDVWAEIDGAS